MEIGEVVRMLRKQAGYSQDKLAYSIPGYDGGNLSRFERGVQSIDLDKLKAIAATLNTTLAEMFAIAESATYNDTAPGQPTLTAEIDELVTQYIHADERGRDSIMGIARIQTEKQAIKNLPKAHDGNTAKSSLAKKRAKKR
ncbi:MAG: helix-turn-helix domain-containing protein [Candidatus Thiodiazotropha sp. (ex Ctena orbiculata)]|nr:helix-turn-helix domain-containing protein [Candidatus Thiodiazotropha taylori]